jgi:site-specific recombinase XerD|nr:MAG TPA: Integrase [Caudoviricetes sp.]
MERRKDSKGRVLKKGESERKDGRYQYRYNDAFGARKTVYANGLNELRDLEKRIEKDIGDGIDYSKGQMTVYELVERYLSLKQGVRYNTRIGYNFVSNILGKEPFSRLKVSNVKVSDAQKWIIKMYNDGKGYSTLSSICGVVKPAFQMACNEDVIRKNPFDFKITDVVPNNSKKREALTEDEQIEWLSFIKNDKTYCKYYDEFVVLLNTGMRVSEFCGLTSKDLDFNNRKINVDHQLVRERNGKYYVEKTKTQAGCRFIPMTNEVFQSLKRIIENRPKLKIEPFVDGYTGFILVDKNGNPKIALHIENEIRWSLKKYKKLFPNKPPIIVTPHVLRHTFCTNMINAGMDAKKLQYLMGHSDVSTTLNIYTHMGYEKASEQMLKIYENAN